MILAGEVGLLVARESLLLVRREKFEFSEEDGVMYVCLR